MTICVNCKDELSANQIIYKVTDLDADIMIIVEETIGREAKVHDSLCSHCFETIACSSNEDGEDGSVKDKEFQDPVDTIQLKTTVEISENEEDEDLDAASSSSEYDAGPVVKLQSKTCIVCSKEFDGKQLYSLPLGPQRDVVENYIHPKKLSRHSVVCKDCLQTSMEEKEKPVIVINNTDKPIPGGHILKKVYDQGAASTESELIYVPNYYGTSSAHKKCFVKTCHDVDHSRKVVPRYLRRILLENYNVFVPNTARSCTEHRREYYRDWNHLRDKKLYTQTFNSQQIEEMLEILKNDT